MDSDAHKPVVTGEDTIAALATAVGGPIAIIRLSGDRAAAVAATVWEGRAEVSAIPHRLLRLGRLTGGDGAIDNQALAVYMPAPRSYTGEDMVELHCHGGVLSARLALVRILDNGARHAEPGEFTKRAFLNGKMDLTQAEAVADIIEAHSEAALRVANRQLDGLLGTRVTRIYDRLIALLAEVEVRLDFPEDDLDTQWESPERLVRSLDGAREALTELLRSRNEGDILRHGVQLVIAGPPNVGKSSLMNAILGRDRAIVTHIPGTTRDTLEELAHIRGIPVRLVDTAGIREARGLVEKTGIERSYASIAGARVVLWVIDVSQPYAQQQCPMCDRGQSVILVGNKKDLTDRPPSGLPPDLPAPIYTCALTGDGLEALFDAIERTVWEQPHREEPEVAVSVRHALLLEEASEQGVDAKAQICAGQWELAAVALRGAIGAVGKVTGKTAGPDILDTIFAKFCIGK